jgi:hypothetical protein
MPQPLLRDVGSPMMSVAGRSRRGPYLQVHPHFRQQVIVNGQVRVAAGGQVKVSIPGLVFS